MSKQRQHLYEFGPYCLLPSERLLLRDGEQVTLTPKAFETLVALVERAGRLVEKDELLNEVWAGTTVEESNVAQNVFALRRVLGKSEDGSPYIETVPKRGYRFLPKVKVSEDRGEELRTRLQSGKHAPPKAQAPTATPDAPTHTQACSDAAVSNVERSIMVAVALPQTTMVARPWEAAEAQDAAARLIPRSGWWVGLLVLALASALVGFGVVIARLFLSPPPASPPSSIKMSRLMSGGRIWSAAVSPDGRHVAHVVEHAGQTSIWVRQVSTTTDLHVIPPDGGATYWGLSFSRDGDHLYYVKHSQSEPNPTLYRVPALGGSSRKIVTGINSHVTTSPDSKQIAFIIDSPSESVLMIANADGTNERRLGVRRGPDHSFSSTPRGGPSWSPDGQSIATGVISLKGGYHGEVIIVSVNDGTERQLASRRWYQVAQVSWLSDGSGLLATARDASGGAQIWFVSYPEGAVRKVTNDLNDYHGVSLTADSRTLVTVQYDRLSTIAFSPEKPPSASQRNTAGMNEGFYGMSWTPEGKLAYASEASGNLDIWIMGTDGVTAEQLTTDAGHDSTPSVSPDGRSVAFVSYRDGGNPHIWRMDIDGGNQRRLTNQAFEGTPSFTPDGHWVVYAEAGSGIWKVPAEGGPPLLILGNAHTPNVSPDGSLVACFYWDKKLHPASKIALVAMEGGTPVKFLDEPKDMTSSAIRWTADGRSLVYVGTRDDVSNLWTLPLDGAPPRPLTNFPSDLIFNFAWSLDNKQLALARGNTAEHVLLIGDFR
jgi:Tol biopolymer transport system component/DNA-binding winged helix-turn-helix (wHTH) protein